MALLLVFSVYCLHSSRRKSWAIISFGKNIVYREGLLGKPCYIVALSAWDENSRLSIQALAKISRHSLTFKKKDELPAIILVFFDSTERDSLETVTILKDLPFIGAYGSEETARLWRLDTVPSLYLWDGNDLELQHCGFIDDKYWQRLLDS